MRRKNGFTLIEMVIVIGIIIIMSAVLIMGLPQYITKANTASGAAESHNNKYDAAKAEVDALGGVMGAPAPAVIPPVYFLVTFVDWDTTTVLKPDTVVSGGTAVPPSNPSRTGFTFSGWNSATFTNITADMTVTAQYTANPVTYAVTFVYHNGSDTLVSTPVTVNDGAAAAPPVSNPIWPGHTFGGWNPTTFTNVTEDMTITAQYTANPVKISISAITGVTKPVKGAVAVTSVPASAQYTATISWSPVPPSGVFAKNTAYTATITITPKAGYTLAGVTKNYFKVSGGTATNAVGSGIVKVVFSKTAS